MPLHIVRYLNSSSQFFTGKEASSVARMPSFGGGGIRFLRADGPGHSVSWKLSSQLFVCCSDRKGVHGPGSAQMFSEVRRSFVWGVAQFDRLKLEAEGLVSL